METVLEIRGFVVERESLLQTLGVFVEQPSYKSLTSRGTQVWSTSHLNSGDTCGFYSFYVCPDSLVHCIKIGENLDFSLSVSSA